jgi:putative heme transporter
MTPGGRQWFWRQWKMLLNIFTLVALAMLLYAIRGQVVPTFDHVTRAGAWMLLIIVPLEGLNYHAQARLYQKIFRVLGDRLAYWQLYRASLELNFVNHMFPSGGVTGFSYFALRMRREGQVSGTRASLVQCVKLAMVFIAFEAMLAVGVAGVAVSGHGTVLAVLVAAALTAVLALGGGAFLFVVGDRNRLGELLDGAAAIPRVLMRLVRRSETATVRALDRRNVGDEFHTDFSATTKAWKKLNSAFWYALLANVTEVAVIFCVFVAFGHWVNVGAIIIAYGVANFAGLISVLPGGVGIYEALMVVVLGSMGVSPAVTLPVIVTYRILNTLVQVPPGYVFYQRTLSRSGARRPVTSPAQHASLN